MRWQWGTVGALQPRFSRALAEFDLPDDVLFRVRVTSPGTPEKPHGLLLAEADRERVAVFVDGCFWHGCPRHATKPANNRAFWQAKLARNAARDREVTRELRKVGWTVVRVWECALTRSRARATLARVARVLAVGG